MIFPQLAYIINRNTSLIEWILFMKKKYTDYIGNTVFKWKILGVFRKNYRDYFEAQCDCGKKSQFPCYRVFSGYTKSCSECVLVKHGNYRTTNTKLIGKKFGCWDVISEAGMDKKSNKLVLCRCDCGVEQIKRASLIVSGKSNKCKKCYILERRKNNDLTGFVFGKWTIIKQLEPKNNSDLMYFCKCMCGNEKIVSSYALKVGKSRSCVCCRIKTHGMSYTSIFRIWRGLFQRCYNKNNKAYKYYGGRGIKVCDRWKKFDNFFNDMGIRPAKLSIDRINNDGDYEPGNCRWATSLQQRHNQRKSK